MVARVDTVLREELGIPDGLADPRVNVLDPCCGTGAYLVEVLRHIAATLQAKGEEALLGHDLKRASLNRVFGFEILPAPFVVAHMQLGLLLQQYGAPLSASGRERAGVYLTNALTGWEPPDPGKERVVQLQLAGMPELKEERDAARKVKRDVPILVVLGNPPYNGFAGVSPAEEQGLLEPYKQGLKDWGITKNYLDDLYVRFFRLAERRIAEQTGQGIVCYISNFSYLSEPSFAVMRERFLSQFDRLWFDCLNGDSRWTGKLTPDGKRDPSIFSTEYNPQGIQVGTVIGLMVRGDRHVRERDVRFRDLWGSNKWSDLLASLGASDFDGQYREVTPTRINRFSFRPSIVASKYASWPTLQDLSYRRPMLGLNDNRGQALHDLSRDVITQRMCAYYDPGVSFDQISRLHPGLTTDAAAFDAKATRDRLQQESHFHEENVHRFGFKPYDLRWAYIERTTNLWNRVRPELLDQISTNSEYLIARCHAPRAKDGAAIYYSRHLADQHILHKDAYFIPFHLRFAPSEGRSAIPRQLAFIADKTTDHQGIKANLSQEARSYLANLGFSDDDIDGQVGSHIWLHALAVGCSPRYLDENSSGIQSDWPRIPLPASREGLAASAELGRQVAALLDPETAVQGTTAGALTSEMRTIAVISRVGGGALDAAAGDLDITAG